jgi:hypothetical protein
MTAVIVWPKVWMVKAFDDFVLTGQGMTKLNNLRNIISTDGETSTLNNPSSQGTARHHTERVDSDGDVRMMMAMQLLLKAIEDTDDIAVPPAIPTWLVDQARDWEDGLADGETAEFGEPAPKGGGARIAPSTEGSVTQSTAMSERGPESERSGPAETIT